MEEMKDRIKKARVSLGLRQKDVGDYVGVSAVAIGQWERGEYQPNGENLLRLSQKLRTTADWLMYGKEPAGNVGEAPAIYGRLPLISFVTAGKWKEIVDSFQPGEADDWIETTSRVGKRAFALRVEGDSMVNPHGSPSIPDGCIIIVNPDIEPNNGSFVVAKIPGEEKALFKKFVKDGPRCYLMPLNPKYREIEIDENCVIVGVVKRVEFDLNR